MRKIRWAALLCALGCLLVVSSASAGELPLYGNSFPEITEAASPEQYAYRVEVPAGDYLEQISETLVEISDGGHELGIPLYADPAHDGRGYTVPTTLSATGPDEVTLTVHHLAGNPNAGWAPFSYPIQPGMGSPYGFPTIVVQMLNPNRAAEEEAIRAANPAAEPAPPPTVDCHVPNLVGLSRREAAGKLRGAHCALGEVRIARGSSAAHGKVVRQFETSGRHLAAGSSVAIKLGSPRSR
jgi:hypothetical protein